MAWGLPPTRSPGGNRKQFFDELFALHDNHSDDEEDDSFRIPPALASSGRPSLRDSVDGSFVTSGVLAKTSRVRGVTSISAVPKTRSSSIPSSSSNLTSSTPQRKKEKLFEGLCFCRVFKDPLSSVLEVDGLDFIPNNRKNPVRKIRIQKAEDNGAKCIFGEFRPEVITHVIVDTSFNYNGALKEINLRELPNNIAVVKDNYSGDCLHYKRIVDPTQFQYLVSGYKKKSQEPEPDSGPGPTGLQVKRKIDSVEETPLRGPPSSFSTISTPSQTGIRRQTTAPPTSPDASNRTAPVALADDLEKVIADAKVMPHLDDEVASAESDEGYDSETQERKRKIRRKERRPKGQQGLFQCLSKNDGNEKDNNPNKRTIEVLVQMQDYYERVKDHWRTLGYRKAVTTLKRQDRRICFADDAIRLPGIGSRIAQKIEEIVQTDQLKRLEYANLEPVDVTIKLFLGIYGVGLVQAQKWVAEGYKSLDELKEKAKLSESQLIGINHYEDFNSRMKREEVKQHGDRVIAAVLDLDPALVIEIMGSYRRGSSTCGDIDIMITKKDAEAAELTGKLKALTTNLMAMSFLKCGLAIPRGRDDGSKWHGASALTEDAPWRRIDFLIVPWDERGAALIYFTGNDIFNRSLRLLASKKGYRLNQRGLYKNVLRGPARASITEGTLVEGASEKRIFEILGVPYRLPEERNC